MHHAASSGQLLVLRCKLCGRSANYWTADLLKVVGPHHEVHLPPFGCSRCRTKEYKSVKVSVPAASELNKLTVRRPVKQITKSVWRDERA